MSNKSYKLKVKNQKVKTKIKKAKIFFYF